MTNLKKFFDGFQNLNGASFIALNNYFAKTTGEIANHTVNTNISVENAKKGDLSTLKSTENSFLMELSEKYQIPLDIFQTALNEMIVSAEKNLSKEIENRTAKSIAQTGAYMPITKAIRIHKETNTLHIFGMHIQKTIIKTGEPKKQVNSSPKTIAKRLLTKELNLRAGKFRTFIVSNIDNINMSKDTIDINL